MNSMKEKIVLSIQRFYRPDKEFTVFFWLIDFSQNIISRHMVIQVIIENDHSEKKCFSNVENENITIQLTFTCSNLTIETLEQGVKYVQN